MRKHLAALALALSTALTPVAAAAETLTDALIMAYRHSGLLEQNRAVLRAADEDVAQAIATLRPILSYTASVTRTWTFPNDRTVDRAPLPPQVIEDSAEDNANIGIQADLLLWDGGASQYAIDAAKETVLATREALLAVEQNVLFQAVDAYIGVREAEALVNLGQSNVRLISEQLRAARDRFDVGEVTRTDVAIAEASMASARSNLAAAQGDLAIARAVYEEQIGARPGQLSDPGRLPQTANSVAAAESVAARMHPEIRRDTRLITVAELNAVRAERSIRPSISATGSFSVGNDFEEQASIGLQMQGPIYRGGELASVVRQAIARRDEQRAVLHQTIHLIKRRVASAFAQLQVARARISAADSEVQAAQVAFRGAQEEATLGARTTLEVLDTEQDLLDARVNAITARTGEVRAVYSLLQAMGLLTVEHLGLGIVTYDPSAYYNAVSDAPVRNVSPQGEQLDRLLRSLGRN